MDKVDILAEVIALIIGFIIGSSVNGFVLIWLTEKFQNFNKNLTEKISTYHRK